MGKHIFEDAVRLPRWAIVALMAFLVILFFVGPDMPNSGVVQLETILVEVNGFLLAFISVAFTGMVAEIRSQSDLAVEQRKKLSKRIRVESIRGFFFLIISLIASIGVVTNAIAYPSGHTPEYFAYAFPVIFLVFGLFDILVALVAFLDID